MYSHYRCNGLPEKIADEIIDKGADYILALKGNQGKLFEQTENFFNEAEENNFNNINNENYVTEEKNHGREEKREYRLVNEINFWDNKDDWNNLNSIGMVTSTRIIGGKETTEKRYYISSLSGEIERFAEGVRKHWGIENKLHYNSEIFKIN